MTGNPDTLAAVKHYYGEVLQSSSDLQTSACCLADAMPAHLIPLLKDIHPEIKDRFYGCGSPIPPAIEGATVLDLGCGTGRDVYLLSRLVGPTGRVIGLDMTEAQLAVGRRHQAWHAERYGHDNVDFRHGYIEDLASAGACCACSTFIPVVCGIRYGCDVSISDVKMSSLPVFVMSLFISTKHLSVPLILSCRHVLSICITQHHRPAGCTRNPCDDIQFLGKTHQCGANNLRGLNMSFK